MNVRALVCCRCGGPLANPEALPALIDCLYCGTVNSAAHASANQASTQASNVEAAWQARRTAVASFTAALVESLKAGHAPLDALRAASSAHLGIAGRAETVARISLALARDFEREAKVNAVRDANILSRIAQAYLLALDELRTSESYDLNLPFLTANDQGPVHFRRVLTAKDLLVLAERDPGAEAAPAPPAKKKGWWPF